MRYALKDLIDIPKIQTLIDSFYNATGIPAAVVTNEGQVLIKAGWQKVCVEFHRRHPDTNRKCIESATQIKERLRSGSRYAIYRCPNGLIDAAAPIIVAGEHVANVMTGQLFFHKPGDDEVEFFQRQGAKYGFDQVAYLEALSQVPVIPKEKVEHTLDYLAQVAGLLAELGLARLKQIDAVRAQETVHDKLEREVEARTRQLKAANERLESEISSRKEAERALKSAKTELETIIDSVPALITYKDTEGRYVRVNRTYADLIGSSKEALMGKTTADIVPHVDLAERYLRDDRTVIASESPKRNIIEPLAFDPQRTVQTDKVPFRDINGRVKGVIAIASDITPRLAAESALKESEERLRLIFELAPDAYYLSDLEGRLLDVNRAAERLSGYTKQELVGRSFLEIGLLSPDQVPTALTRLAEHTHGTPSGPYEYVVNRKDGGNLTVAITTHQVEIGSEKVILGIGRDITNEKRAREEAVARMKRRKDQDSMLVQVTSRPEIVKGELEVASQIITESSAKAMEVERAGFWLLNDDRTELQCLDLYEKHEQKHTKGQILRAADYPHYFEAFESSRTIDAHDARSDPRTREFKDAYLEPNNITSMLDAAIRVSGVLVGVVCYEHVGAARTWQDDEIAFAGEVADQAAQAILNHRRASAAEALRESEKRYRSLVENMPIAVYRTTPGPRGKFLMANPMFLTMFGLKSERELDKMSVADLYNDPGKRKAFSERLMREGIVEDAEFHLRKKGGLPFWGSVTARVQHGDNGQDVYFDCTIVDITERKRAEEEKEKLEAQLQHAQKMEAIGTLAGGIAHNFNNLLMAIQGNASLLMLATNQGHPHFDMLRSIEKSVESGSRLTNQLLGYAREGRYEVRSVNLNRLVKETVETFSTTRKDIRVHLDLIRDLDGIEADHTQIEQVLLNLMVNAADAMPTGGALFIRTERVTERDMRNKPYRPKPGAYALLTVRDTGFGMDASTMERIFDPFFTTKGLSKGTGLGLASVYGIVKAHGGYIDVDSSKGRGSTFSIYLPVSVGAMPSTSKGNQGAINGSETILIVDDEEVVLDVGMRVLEALGYRVLGAKGGFEALEIYQTNRDRIDLVILDMVMPDMAGGETYDRMKKIDQNVKVLLSSGYSIDGQASEILERGCDGFIQKPFNMEDLSTSVREVLEQPQ